MAYPQNLTATAPQDTRLLVIYAGGTIGMEMTPHGLAPGSHFAERLEQALTHLAARNRQRLPSFDIISYSTPIDSSAANPVTWQQLASDIATQYQHYDGFVILHGTDTLSWSASSLAYQLQGLACPVVVTGAMQPLEVANGDALENIEGALHFASNSGLQEVAVYFAGQLLRGVRTTKQHTESPMAFTSPNHPLLGERIGEEFVYYPSHGLAASQRGAPRFELADYHGMGEGKVVRISLWPGIAPWQLEAWLGDSRVQGGLLQLWGAGNFPPHPELLEVLATASGEGKLIAGISQCPQGSVHLGSYAAGHDLVEAGVLSGDGMTPEAAYTKLVHLLAQPIDDTDRRRRFLTPLVGER
ncbi:asparaginase [Halomonas sp. Bachu 37]|uniref:asparaginase n=1 Tax=Halomonas kashgarensis TaxID=3084920 RepID=UPI00321664C9